MSQLARFVVRVPWVFIALFVGVTLAVGSNLRNVVIDSEVKSQLPPDIPSLINARAIEGRFGGTEMVLVVLEAPDVTEPAVLEQLREIHDDLSELDAVEKVLSVYSTPDISRVDGQFHVSVGLEELPSSAEEQAALREALKANDMVYGNVVARDFTALSAIALLSSKSTDSETIDAVREVMAAHPSPATLSLGGMPSVRVNVSRDIRSDVGRFVPIGLFIVLAFLYVCFRQVRGVLLPFSVVVMSVIVAMGLIPVFGWKVQMVTVVLPVILLAVANDYGIHLMAKLQEENTHASSHTPQEMAVLVVEDLGTPVIAAGITTIAGLLCLTTHIIVPAAQLGILAAIGVGFALLASLMFIPAVLAVLPLPEPVATGHDEEGSLLDRGLVHVAHFVAHSPRLVVAAVGGTALVASLGLAFLQVDTNPVNYYPSGAEVAVTSDKINRYFGGSTEVSLMVEGDIKSPEVMSAIDAVSTELSELPQVGYQSSIASVVKSMHAAVLGEGHYAVPAERPMISQLFLLLSSGSDPEDFERMVDFDHEHALITVRVNNLSTQEIAAVVEAAEASRDKHLAGYPTTIGGFGYVFAELVDAVVEGQILSLGLSLVLVLILVAIAFRSPVAGLFAVLPLGMAMPVLFGLMGYLGIELNIVTAMLSSIMIGVGVDYTIHFLWRYRAERREGLEPALAVRRTLTTAGRGIVFNALSVVVGFAVLLISNFLPVKFFGFLVVVSISACLVGALALLPALVLLVRPRFLEP